MGQQEDKAKCDLLLCFDLEWNQERFVIRIEYHTFLYFNGTTIYCAHSILDKAIVT
jgi:hypothetical protein